MCAYVANRAYLVLYSGRCQSGFEIKSISECSAAAKALNAPDTSASSDGLYGNYSNPPFCYFKHGQLKFNAGSNRGSCDQAYACLCSAAPATTTPHVTFSPHFGASHHGENDMSVCLSVYLCVCVCLSVCLSVCLPVFLSVCLCVCLSGGLSACLPVFLSVCASAYLAVGLYR